MSPNDIVKANIDLAKILEAINSIGNQLSSLTTTIKDHSPRLKDVEVLARKLELDQTELKSLEKDIKMLVRGQEDLKEDVDGIRKAQTKLNKCFSDELNLLKGNQDKNSFLLAGGGKVFAYILGLVITAIVTWWVTK